MDLDVSKVTKIEGQTERPITLSYVETLRSSSKTLENEATIDNIEKIKLITDLSDDIETKTPEEICEKFIPTLVNNIENIFPDDLPLIENLEDLKKYLSDLVVRFDTSPRNYQKEDYGVLLKVIYKSLIHLYKNIYTDINESITWGDESDPNNRVMFRVIQDNYLLFELTIQEHPNAIIFYLDTIGDELHYKIYSNGLIYDIPTSLLVHNEAVEQSSKKYWANIQVSDTPTNHATPFLGGMLTIPDKNTIHAELGYPSLFNIALFNEMDNKTLKYPTDALYFETSDDRINWEVYLVDSTQIDSLLRGDIRNQWIDLPKNKYCRLTITSKEYVYLNTLVMYLSTEGSLMNIFIEKLNINNEWVPVITDPSSYRTWPGIWTINHDSIPFHPSPQSATITDKILLHSKVRITFIITLDEDPSLFVWKLGKLQWYGVYPFKGNNNPWSTDGQLNVTFPSNISGLELIENGISLTNKYASKSDITLEINARELSIQDLYDDLFPLIAAGL